LNFEEAKQFVRELITTFPAFETAAKESPDLGATHRGWIAAWDDLSLAECQSALARLRKQGGIGWDDYRQPGPFIRRLVLAERGQRSEQSFADEASRFGRMARQRDYVGSPMAAVVIESIKMRQEGASQADIDAVVEAAFPTPAEYDRPRYKCHACSDRGILDAWKADIVAAIRAGRIRYEQLNARHVYVIACSCELGRQKNQIKKPNPVYSAEKFCRFLNRDLETEVAELKKFIDKPPVNYEPAFSGWSGGL
jgi:hypothetical protein